MKFPDVEVWDYGNYSMPENCFKDINHLNGRGAEIFSKELARRMREEGIMSFLALPWLKGCLDNRGLLCRDGCC